MALTFFQELTLVIEQSDNTACIAKLTRVIADNEAEPEVNGGLVTALALAGKLVGHRPIGGRTLTTFVDLLIWIEKIKFGDKFG